LGKEYHDAWIWIEQNNSLFPIFQPDDRRSGQPAAEWLLWQLAVYPDQLRSAYDFD
jgi:hypothetical protein